jgi:rSAM/selenodomain-associated transferase 2
MSPARTLTVVIPALNEASSLPETIQRARANPEIVEMIVVDGGSSDGTDAIATQFGCTLLRSKPGRGTQMGVGAEAARADAVLLLHADTWLPPHAARAALECLNTVGIAGGGFWKEFRDPPLLLRGSKFKCAVRLRLGRRIAGDQGLFVRRNTLDHIGGIPDVPLMEEFELCTRLRRRGRLALADAVVLTSARRFMQRGVIRTYVRMWSVTIRYYLGTSPQELQRIYNRR